MLSFWQGQPFLAHAPFNQLAFQEYREALLAKMEHVPEETCLLTAEAMQARGDVRSADAMRQIAALCSTAATAAASASSRSGGVTDPRVARQVEQVHHVVVERDGPGYGPRSTRGNGDNLRPVEGLPAGFDVKKMNTWPVNPIDLPPFAASANFADLTNVKDFVDEYCHGLGDAPAIRDLEQAYGPKVRRGQDGRYSWRSKRNRGNVRAWDVEFGKRFAAYAIIDDIGEARASRVIQDKFVAQPRRTGSQESDRGLMRAVLDEVMPNNLLEMS